MKVCDVLMCVAVYHLQYVTCT